MDKAKAAVSDFMSKAGKHDTTVHEKVAPAVQQERIHRHEHEQAQTAIDREVHQDHYHTSVQPIKDREVLPEQHTHNIVPVEHREVSHGDSAAIKARLEQEAAQFRSTRTEGETKHTQSAAPVIAGEHVHHHVHETIQPVVQKETIQPSVVHTTVPIHEVHHNESKHHTASALPAVSMADFKKQGGSLAGREERYDGFEGEPRAIGSALGASGTSGVTGSHTTGSGLTGTHDHGRGMTGTGMTGSGTSGSGLTGSGTSGSGLTGTHHHQTTAGPHGDMGNKLDPRVDSDMDGSRNMGANRSGVTNDPTGAGYGSNTTGTSGTSHTKPSLLDRMNPMKSTDRYD